MDPRPLPERRRLTIGQRYAWCACTMNGGRVPNPTAQRVGFGRFFVHGVRQWCGALPIHPLDRIELRRRGARLTPARIVVTQVVEVDDVEQWRIGHVRQSGGIATAAVDVGVDLWTARPRTPLRAAVVPRRPIVRTAAPSVS